MQPNSSGENSTRDVSRESPARQVSEQESQDWTGQRTGQRSTDANDSGNNSMKMTTVHCGCQADCETQDAEMKQDLMVPYRKLWSFATPLDYGLIALGVLGAVGHGAILPIMMILLGRFVNVLGSNQHNVERAFEETVKISLICVYVGAASIFVTWLEVACWMYAGERQAVQIRTRYLRALLSQSITYFDTRINTGEIIDRLSSDMLAIHEAMGEKVASFILNMSIFILAILAAFVETWQVALITLGSVPLLLGTGLVYGNVIAKFIIRAQTSNVKAGNIASEAFSQVRTVYSFVAESRTISAFSEAQEVAAKWRTRAGLTKGIGVGVSIGIVNLSWALALWYGGILIRKGHTSGGNVMAAVFNVVFGGMAFGQALPELQVFVRGRVAAFKVFKVIDRPMENMPTDETLAAVRGEIEFRKVYFAYPSRPDVTIFHDFSLTIPAGQTVALVGSSGSGKSSVLSLIERFYHPNSGEITLDGRNLKELNLRWLRMQIGIVSQEPVLFSGTVMENIRRGKVDASATDVEAAAIGANAHSFIVKLPHGYDTIVGEKGMRLSGGQKQRLAIARSIVKKPTILLLDEATSALDSQSEQMVQIALGSIMRGRTTVLVAHRLSTVQNADMIVVMDHGRIVETGSHSQLLGLGNDGVYASLVRIQESKPAPRVDSNVVRASVSLGSSPPRSSLHSGATSPVRSLFQSPATPTSARTRDSLNNSYPESPFILPPSPATPRGTLSRATSKEIIESFREKEQSVSKGSNGSYCSIFKLLVREWSSSTLGSVGALITGCLNPLFTLFLIDAVELYYRPDNHQRKVIEQGNLVCCVIAVLGVVNIGSNTMQHFFFNRAGERTSNLLRKNFLQSVLRSEVGWFDVDEHSSSAIASTMSSCGALVKVALSDRASTCIQYLTCIVVAVLLAFFIQWKIAVVTIILLPFTMIGGSMKSVFVSQGFAGNLKESHEKATQVAGEAVSNIRTVAAFCMEEQTLSLFSNSLRIPLRQSIWHAQKGGLLFGLSQAGMHFATALAVWYMAVMIKNNQTTYVPALKVYQVLVWMGYLLAEAMKLFPDLQKGVEAIGYLQEMVNRKTLIDPELSNSLQPVTLTGKLQLDNVTFHYPTRPKSIVLSSFSLTIPKGHTVALVGPSGSGKSSIIALIERFYDPTSGKILIDDLDIKSINLKWLRKHMGLVQQEPVLFARSIRENIQYGKENSTETEVIEAARQANAHGFISALPDGYSTQVGELGVQLSGGEKQRLAIARAVIQDPTILLLDEATSALDTQSEKVVQDALDNMMLKDRRTTIVIAHRLATIQHADTIVLLKNGRIRERGSHSTLMTMNGEYAKLVHLQNLTLDPNICSPSNEQTH